MAARWSACLHSEIASRDARRMNTHHQQQQQQDTDIAGCDSYGVGGSYAVVVVVAVFRWLPVDSIDVSVRRLLHGSEELSMESNLAGTRASEKERERESTGTTTLVILDPIESQPQARERQRLIHWMTWADWLMLDVAIRITRSMINDQ